MKSLSQCLIGESVTVVSMDSVSKFQRHQLRTLGLKPYARIQIKHTAPLGDPICIHVAGVLLALRKSDCQEIWVE